METIDQFLDFLRNGIGEKNSAEPSKEETRLYAKESPSKGVSL
jgi:hypothetical protein